MCQEGVDAYGGGKSAATRKAMLLSEADHPFRVQTYCQIMEISAIPFHWPTEPSIRPPRPDHELGDGGELAKNDSALPACSVNAVSTVAPFDLSMQSWGGCNLLPTL
jgi:hypothetical protein